MSVDAKPAHARRGLIARPAPEILFHEYRPGPVSDGRQVHAFLLRLQSWLSYHANHQVRCNQDNGDKQKAAIIQDNARLRRYRQPPVVPLSRRSAPNRDPRFENNVPSRQNSMRAGRNYHRAANVNLPDVKNRRW